MGEKQVFPWMTGVHASEELLVKETARWWTAENLGRTVGAKGILPAWQELEQSTDEEWSGVQEELRDWTKEAQKHLKTVKEHGLPLTLQSMEMAFEGKVKPKKGVKGKRR